MSKVEKDLSVGVTLEIKEALETAVAFSGIKSSTYGRIALVEKLCREGFLIHPGTARLEKPSRKNTEVQPQPAI
jgi:hypothetical protein